MSNVESSTRPSTPATAKTVIHWPKTPQAPKKPNTKVLEYLKPTVYKSKAQTEKYPLSQKAIRSALSRAGVLKTSSTKTVSTEVQYPAPRKLTLSVIDGKTSAVIHKNIPTHFLMRVSPKAASVLEPRPWVSRYRIYGPYDSAAVSSVLHAITLSHPIPITSDLPSDLLTFEAALRLGITPSQPVLKPVLTAINALISRTPLTSEVLGFIEKHLGPKDPVFKHTANVLCHQRFTGKVEDIKAFERKVAKRPELQSAMVQIDRAHKEKRVRKNTELAEKKQKLEEKVTGGLEVALELKGEASKQHKETLLKIFKGETDKKVLEKEEKNE